MASEGGVTKREQRERKRKEGKRRREGLELQAGKRKEGRQRFLSDNKYSL